MGLRDIIITIKTTRNFWSAFELQFSNDKKTIVLRDGSTFQLTFDEYFIVRNLFSLGYKLRQVDNNQFSVAGSKFSLIAPFPLLCTLAKLAEDDIVSSVERKGEEEFKIKGRYFELIGSSGILESLNEQSLGLYNCDCSNKIVLDVGAYQGETAVLFSRMGAKHVIIYEPVIAHHWFIRQNLLINNVKAELHEEGIGDRNGTQIIHYNLANMGFGILNDGLNEMEIKIRNITDVLEESHADIAKFDCEGAEESIVHVRTETLRKIDLYIIEVHTAKIRQAIIEKFKGSGFELVNEIRLLDSVSNGVRWQISVIILKRIPTTRLSNS